MLSRRAVSKQLMSAALTRRGALLERMPGMMAAGFIARSGRRVSQRVDGVTWRPNGQWDAFADNQPFRVASVSKMITAAGFMSLVSSGRLDLDADVSLLLDDALRHPAFPDAPLTPRMLLSHTSGLRNGADFPVPFNRPLLARLQAAATEADFGGWWSPVDEPPGHWFAYSDTNFAVLAQIIEQVTRQRFDHFMHETLFAPLGLEIGYNWSGVGQRRRNRAAAACRWIDGAWRPQVDETPPQAPAPSLYRADGDTLSTERDYRIGSNGFAFAPHGGLRLDLADMDVLAHFFLHGASRIGADALAAMTAPHWRYNAGAPNGATESGFYQAFGLGVQTPLGRDGDRYFGDTTADWRGHCGDAYGWMTGVWWNARTQSTLVYAINGMPEIHRARAQRSAMTVAEEALIAFAFSDLS